MASLDAARRQLAVHGEALLDRTIARLRAQRARRSTRSLGARCVGEEFVGRPGIAGWDPLRIVIDVRGTGCTGYEVAGGAARLATTSTSSWPRTPRSCWCSGSAQPVEPLERLSHDFAETVRRIARPGASATRSAGLRRRSPHETVVSPRDAFLGRGETVPVDEAVGRISCESIAGYPPGRAVAAARRADHRRGGRPTCAS